MDIQNNFGKTKIQRLYFIFGLIVLAAIASLFIFSSELQSNNVLVSMAMSFYSILIDSLPFLCLGSLISVIIHIYVPQSFIEKLFTKNSILGIFMASFSGIILPLCECGIVPIVRRLLNKGVRPSVAITAFLALPLLNPLVFGATMYAFSSNPGLGLSRFALGWIIIIIIGLCLLVLEKTIFKEYLQTRPLPMQEKNDHAEKKSFKERITHLFEHTLEEVFTSGTYLILGALIAAPIQTFLIIPSTSDASFPILLIIGAVILAILLSLCSTTDAFVARGFLGILPQTAILAFLIAGPILHLRNILMLRAIFKVKTIIRLSFFVIAITIILLIGTELIGVFK